MIGRHLGRYEILESIGSGGMGSVYRAHDVRLHRDVAIKVLPPGQGHDEMMRRRFRHEALALSRLNHPNIATIYDFDRDQDLDFLVMELVSGESLASRIARGPLQPHEIRRLGEDLLRGLGAAHDHGVLHRDLKPANLQVTADERLKILDFGIARLTESPAGITLTNLTDSTSIAGTLAYMAPERILGQEADVRSDVYGAGAVLYEMATGHPPLGGAAVGALVHAILNEPPVPPSRVRPDLPPSLERAILRALEKAPERRTASARQLGLELAGDSESPTVEMVRPGRPRGSARMKWQRVLLVAAIAGLIGAGFFLFAGRLTSEASEASIAVLPLANLSGDPGQEYFADGMTEELIMELSKIATLRVISRTSVMRYKNATRSLPEIARELRVSRLVEGSVVRVGSRVRIMANLMDARDRSLWTEHYDRDVSDILTTQAEVARKIAERIRVRVTPDERARLARSHTVNPRAYEAYLRGLHDLDRQNKQSYENALESFRLAASLDPSDALSWTGMAEAFYEMSSIYLPAQVAMPRVREAAQKALSLDPELGPAHAALGVVLAVYDWKWKEAEAEYLRAIELTPGHAPAHFYYGNLLFALGRIDESRKEMERALALNPLSNQYELFVGFTSLAAGDIEGAIADCGNVLARDSTDAQAYFTLALCHGEQGRFDEAIAEAKTAIRLSDHPFPWAVLGNLYARSGRRREALEILRRFDRMPRSSYQCTYPARIYAGLGMYDEAFARLDEGLARREEELASIKLDPLFRTMRSDPRFAELLRKLDLPV